MGVTCDPLWLTEATRHSFAVSRSVPLASKPARNLHIMNLRQLGTSELQVSPLMLGGNVFGWTADEPTSFRILDAFVDRGFNFIDTADVYSVWAPGHVGGESETVIGNWVKRSGKRDKVVLATKVGMEMPNGKVCLNSTFFARPRTL